MSEHEQMDQADITENGTSGRRDLFTKAGAAAAVAAVAGLAVSKSAEAADGGNMLIGRNNEGNTLNTTRLTGGTSLYVVDGISPFGSEASIRGSASADDHAGVRGEATGSAGHGVRGISSGSGGAGVRGENSGSEGSGVYGLTTANGSTGGGVYGRNNGDGHGVKGQATAASGAGVYGLHTASGGRGVYGHHDNASQWGTGVIGVAALGIGIEGRGTDYDLHAGSSGRLGLGKAGNSGSPSDSGTIGTIARDSAGNLWYCYAANKWQRVAGPAAAGSFHPIAPVRVFDSRNPAFPSPGGFAASTSRVISVKDGRNKDTGAITSADAVPAGATAVAFNVTGTNAAGGNFLSNVPGDVTTTSVSTLNWSGPGISIANAGLSKLDGSRQVRIIAGPGGAFDAIIDISGYYI
jgi:hypothetical protein